CSYRLSCEFTRSSREFMAEFTAPFYRELLACSFLLIGGAEGAFGFGDRQKRRVKLHECRVYGGMRLMAAVAIGGLGNHLRRLFAAEIEKRPFAGKASSILHVNVEAHNVRALIITGLVD